MQMGRGFIHVQMSRIYMKMGIAFQKAVIELIQNLLCQLAILAGSRHIIFIANLKNHFIKRLFLITLANFFIVVFDTTVFTFLLGIVLSLRFIKQLMVGILYGRVAVFDVQMGSCLINIFCEVGTAIMGNYTIAGHRTDCSFHTYHLRFCNTLIRLTFAACRRVLLLLPKVTQKHF